MSATTETEQAWTFVRIEEPEPGQFVGCLGQNRTEDLDDLDAAQLACPRRRGARGRDVAGGAPVNALPYDPWADLASRTGVELKWHTGRVSRWEKPLGVTNFHNLSVTLLLGQDEHKLRCTLAHELIHLERGPVGLPWANRSPRSEESRVHLTAAQRLIDPDAYEAWLDHRSGDEAQQSWEARHYCRVDARTLGDYHQWRRKVTDRTAERVWRCSTEPVQWPPAWLGANAEMYVDAARFAGLAMD